MTQALLNKAFRAALYAFGYWIAVDAGGLTASVFSGQKCVGKIKYTENSVDYDDLMRLIRLKSVDAERMKA